MGFRCHPAHRPAPEDLRTHLRESVGFTVHVATLAQKRHKKDRALYTEIRAFTYSPRCGLRDITDELAKILDFPCDQRGMRIYCWNSEVILDELQEWVRDHLDLPDLNVRAIAPWPP